MSTDRAMSAQTSSATIASSAAGPSTSDRSSTSTHVDIPNHTTTSSSSSSSLRRRKSRNGKERAYSQFTSGMMADERIHSTMTKRVFKIKCFERVQVEKSTSAFSSILRKASSPSKAALPGLKARKSFSGTWNGQDGNGSTGKDKDRQSILRIRGSSLNSNLDTFPSRRISNNVLTSYQWREVTLEAHVDASPAKIYVFDGNRLLRTFDPIYLRYADVYMASSSIYPEEHPHVLVIRNRDAPSPSKPSASSSSPQSTDPSAPTSPLRSSVASSPINIKPGAGFKRRSSSFSFATSLFPSSATASPLAATSVLSDGKWLENRHKSQPSVSSIGSGESPSSGGGSPKSKIRRQVSSTTSSSSAGFHLKKKAGGDALHLSFPTITAMQAWYTLIQAFASVEGGHRSIVSTRLSAKAIATPVGEDGMTTSSAVSLSSTSTDSTEAGLTKQQPATFRSWSRLEISSLEALKLDGVDGNSKFFCEIYIDDELRGRSQPITSSNGSMYWSDRFSLEQGWHCNACSVIVRKIDRNGVVLDLGTVEIERSRLARQQTESDRRFDILPLGGGEVIGTLRLKLRYIELRVGAKAANYRVWDTLSDSFRRSHLNDLIVIPGCSEAICRAGIALNKLDDLLFSLMEEEVNGPPSTLFRSNTSFTRLLDTTMRLYAADFLQRALGNVIADVIDMSVELEIDSSRMKPEKVDEMEMEVKVWVRRLWQDIYMARDKFPAFLRMIFARLTESVGAAHPGDKKLQQQAVSSFVFLRLIAPAIMWPNLYGLIPYLPSPTTQRSLTSLAKPLLNLSFGIDDRSQDLHGLEALNGWMREECDVMKDFITACSTPIDTPSSSSPPPPPPPTSIHSYLSTLPSTSTISTLHPILGPIDLPVQLALLEKWGEQVIRSKVPIRSSSNHSSAEEITGLDGVGMGVMSIGIGIDGDSGGSGGGGSSVNGEVVRGIENGPRGEEGKGSGDSEDSFKTASNTSLPVSPLLKDSTSISSPRIPIKTTGTGKTTTTTTRLRMEPRDAHVGRDRERRWVEGELYTGGGVGDGVEGGIISYPDNIREERSNTSRKRMSLETDEYVDLVGAIRSLPAPLPSQVLPWSPRRPTIPPRNESRG